MDRFARAILVGVVFFVSTQAAHAGSVIEELRVGVLAQSCCAFSPRKESGVGVNGEIAFHSPTFLSVLGKPRPIIGLTAASNRGNTSQLYAGLEWRADLSHRFFVSGALGGAIHNGETDDYDPERDRYRADETLFMGCRTAFRLAGEAGYRVSDHVSLSFQWAHISNAGLCGENDGLDHMGGRLAYRF